MALLRFAARFVRAFVQPSFALGSGLAAVVLAGACGGGDPASPTFEPVTSAEAGSDDAASSTETSTGEGGAPFASCGSEPASGSIPADVQTVLAAKCQVCHQDPPINGAPFPLLTYAEIHSIFAANIPKYQEMHALIQPDGSPHMPFGKAPQLSTDEFSTLDNWLLDCAPPGE
ncbi:MAG TPA: hypothetical protein VHV30_03405 [Polyangiaceae bacterium]|jgi:hypothetical protein|nr:hypothetical protein [Polyangiaceae bacterium]